MTTDLADRMVRERDALAGDLARVAAAASVVDAVRVLVAHALCDDPTPPDHAAAEVAALRLAPLVGVAT